ncbi:unnamed protein product [Paramecium primaurelia]|uniref:Uncharacterized protein n=1 Tax=Paramecium primaurelia TaxID=5886 RepID=A0A8S1LA68_PARPR|nr:unnamed protein product [Paramecium primaurelia]
MKKNVASSSTPNSKKNSAKYFQQDQFQQQPQISQFISIEDQSQSDQLKNDESLISNDLTQACSTNLVLQENQDYRDNQMEFVNNDDDVKINEDLNILNSSDTEKFNQINHQIDNNLINEISQNESISLQNQNPDQYQNLQQEKSHYFNLIENQDQIQQINNERHQYSNKKQITIQINDDEIANYKSEIEQGQQINSELSLNLLEDQTINLVSQQDIEGSLEDDQDQQLINLEDNIENNLNMQTLKIVEKWQDITFVNQEEIKENNSQELIEEHCKTDKIEQLKQIVKESSEQGEQVNVLGWEMKNDIQEFENKQQQIKIKIEYPESNNEEISQNIVKAQTNEQCINEDNNQQSKLGYECETFERGKSQTGYCSIESKQFQDQIQMKLGQDKINKKQELQMKIQGLNSIIEVSLQQCVQDQKQNYQHKDKQDNKCENHLTSQQIGEEQNQIEDQKISQNVDNQKSQHKDEQQNQDKDKLNSKNDDYFNEQLNQDEDQQNSQKDDKLNSKDKDQQQNQDEDQQNSQKDDKLNSKDKDQQQNQDEDQQNSQKDDKLNSKDKDQQQNQDEDQQNSQKDDKLNSKDKDQQQNQDEDQQNSQKDDKLNSKDKDQQQNQDEDQQNSQKDDKLNSKDKDQQQNQDEDQQNSQKDDKLNSKDKDQQQNQDEDQQNSQKDDKLNSKDKDQQQNQDEDQQNSQKDDKLNSKDKDQQQNQDEDQQNSQKDDKLNSKDKDQQQNQDEDQQNSQKDDKLNSQDKDQYQNQDEDQQNSLNDDKLNCYNYHECTYFKEDIQLCQNKKPLDNQVQAICISSGLLLQKQQHIQYFESVSFNDTRILHKENKLIQKENFNFPLQEQSIDVEPNSSKINKQQQFDNLQINSEQRNISNKPELSQQDQESISEIQISQTFLHKFSLKTQNQEKEEYNNDQIININRNEKMFDKIDDLQLDKQTRFLNENQNIKSCNQNLNQFELFSLKPFDQESQVEVGKKNQENNDLLQQKIYIHTEILGEICEQLQQLKIQDLGCENAQEFDLNNNDIQQQVNLEDIEVNKQSIFQEDVYFKLQQQKLENENNQEQHQELNQCEEDQRFCNKEIIEVENNQKLEQNVVMLNFNSNDEEMEQIQQQANNVFQPQINNFSQQNEKMDQFIDQTEDHEKYSNSQENEEGTLSKNQQDSEHTNDIINNQYESSQKKQSIKLIDHSEQHQDFQEEENLLKPQQHKEKQGIEGQSRTFTSQKKISSQRENFFLSQTKIKNQEDSLNQNQFNSSLSQNVKEYNSSKSNDHYNIDLGHGELNRDNYLKENADDLQEQRKQKIRDLEQQIEWAEREIEEKDEEINQNKEMIENFENFVLGNTNPEEFEKIILSESNFETENLLINHLINKLRQFMQEFSNSIIDLINRFDGKTELEKDEEQEQEEQEKIKLITNEFKKFKQKKQQKKEIDDNKNQINIHNLGENNEKIVNDELNILISSIIGQTKLLRDILQKNCCLLIKFNCEVYNGLQGMSKNIKQLEQIKSLTNSVKQTTQHYQSIINEQVDLQQAKDDNNHILLLDLLKQLINKQEQAFQFQQLFTNYLSERIDLVHQSEENLREDMAKRLQTFN